MKFEEKNDFIVKYTGKKNLAFFDKDRELFLKTFPGSPLVPELMRANDYNKENLQGRVLRELLEVTCRDCILENRGVIIDHKESEVTIKNKEDALKVLVVTEDFSTLDKDLVVKPIFELLGLTPGPNVFEILESAKIDQLKVIEEEELAEAEALARAVKIAKWKPKSKKEAIELLKFVTPDELAELKWKDQLQPLRTLTTGEGKNKADVIKALIAFKATLVETPVEETKGEEVKAETAEKTPVEETTDKKKEEKK